MLARIFLALLSLAISIPIYASCPVIKDKVAASHDCCHQTEDCPSPNPEQNAQPCLDCVADVRSTAISTTHAAQPAVPALLAIRVFLKSVCDDAVVPHMPPRDGSSTYLRIGVLRI